MCLSSSQPKIVAASPTPTATSTGVNESATDAKNKDRQKQRAAAGYQQNILSGSSGTSDANVSKKALLG